MNNTVNKQIIYFESVGLCTEYHHSVMTFDLQLHHNREDIELSSSPLGVVSLNHKRDHASFYLTKVRIC